MNVGGKTTNPGELDVQVTLQSRAGEKKVGGFTRPAWVDLARVWARWRNVHGQEVWAASAINAIKPATALIRYRPGIDSTCAVLRGSERYEIVSVDDIENRHEYIELKLKFLEPG